ncbi:Gfo/Idh/MocA family protein [Paenibacillus jiagnxiensis]|uniref:Gfo/Idh/MocA family protein n=1 Tax=Paenibacillus jiagnxiensis TaxID=3228926 RepID=UPI0033AB89E3
MKIRTGIIGTGFGAQVHAPILLKHPDYELTAISSIREGRAEKAAQELGIPAAYDDWKRMMHDSRLDLIVIVSEPSFHMEMTVYALNSGKHVLCEKPPALHLAQVAEMQNTAAGHNRVVSMNFEWRYLPERQAIKTILEEQRLGELFHVGWSEVWPLWPRIKEEPYSWQWDLAKGGGMLGAIGSHMIDALHHWFGPFAEDVYGFTVNHVHERRADTRIKPTNGDDSFFIHGKFKNQGTFSLQFIAAAVARPPMLEIFGSQGTLRLKGKNLSIAAHLDKDYVPIEISEPIDASAFPLYTRGYVHPQWMLYSDLSAAISGSQTKADLPTLNDACIVQEMMDKIRLTKSSSGEQ